MNRKMLSWKSFVLTDAWSGLGCNPSLCLESCIGREQRAAGKIVKGADLPSKGDYRRDSVQHRIKPQFFSCLYRVPSPP